MNSIKKVKRQLIKWVKILGHMYVSKVSCLYTSSHVCEVWTLKASTVAFTVHVFSVSDFLM